MLTAGVGGDRQVPDVSIKDAKHNSSLDNVKSATVDGKSEVHNIDTTSSLGCMAQLRANSLYDF